MLLPEYASSGCITPEADVYSFGIILLEMMTRKKPTDDMFVQGLTLSAWVQGALPHTVEKVIDPALQDELEQDPSGIMDLLQIGLLCTQNLPNNRPTMKEALEMLLLQNQAFESPHLSLLIHDCPLGNMRHWNVPEGRRFYRLDLHH